MGLVTGNTDALRDAGHSVLTVEDNFREESVNLGGLEGRFDFVFHAPIIPHLSP